MDKGQGSMEYLLIMASVLAITVLVVIACNAMFPKPHVYDSPIKCSDLILDGKPLIESGNYVSNTASSGFCYNMTTAIKVIYVPEFGVVRVV
jgi:hypothetical protein